MAAGKQEEQEQQQHQERGQEQEQENLPDEVKIDVGCYLYECPIDLLRKFPDSVLTEQFESNQRGRDYYMRIDRDGKYFGTILKYMENKNSIDRANLDVDGWLKLKTEANFYRLDHLEAKCIKKIESLLMLDTSFKYKIPITTNLLVYLSKQEIPALVLDSQLIKLLLDVKLINKIALVCDLDKYQLIGCTDDFKGEMRLYVRDQCIISEKIPSSSVKDIIQFILLIDMIFRDITLTKSNSIADWTETHLDSFKKTWTKLTSKTKK